MSLRAILRPTSAIQDRTLYLRVKPAPSTLSERRAVLHALKQYGEIEVFKKLRDGSSFISVARRTASFWNIRKASPIQFDYQDEKTSEAVLDPRAATPSSTKPVSPQTFTVEAFPAHDYPHNAAIKKSPLYGPWPQQTDRSMVTLALMQVVPEDMASRALADWETGAQMEDPDARIACLASQNTNVQQRISRRKHKKVLADLDKLLNGEKGEQ